MTGIIAGGNTMAALARYKEQVSDLGFCWLQLFEAENGRPPNEAEIAARRQEIAALEEARRKDRERQDRLERQANENVTIEVGTCLCGGGISYNSWFVAAVSMWDMPVGPRRVPTKEMRECFCMSCGLMYSPEHKPFREKLEAYRKR